MTKVIYLDRGGSRIDRNTFLERFNDQEYTQLRAYDNNRVRVFLTWTGRIENPQDTFPDYYKLFRLDVWNYTANGTLTQDPKSPTFFSNEEAAVRAYEEFLEAWTASERDDKGALVEVDNALAPPPPPDLDKPLSAPSDDDVGGVGAW